MALTKYRLGDFLELFNERCGVPDLTAWDISGVNSDKEFFEPSKQAGSDTSNYKIVPPDYFACNLMHVGRDVVLPIALNHSGKQKIVSPAYTVFKIKDGTPLLKEYFFMMLKSEERDRYFWFHTDASVRDGMLWDDFCDLDVELPSIPVQRRFADVYSAMLSNQQSYERGLEDLKLVCDAYIEELRRKMPCEEIRPYISELNDRNSDLSIENVQGVNSSSSFGETKADTTGLDFRNYKIVKPRQFAYNPSRINLGSIALLQDAECIVSPMYIVFEVLDKEKLLPEYLMMWYGRKEFQRSTLFYATGSVRDTFGFDVMQEVKIPIPKIEIQQDIANIYNAYIMRKNINELLKDQIKILCPILIRGSLEDDAE